MAFIPVPDCILLTARYQDINGITAINRFFFGTATPPDSTMLEHCATTFVDYFTEAIAASMNNNWSLVGVETRDMSTEFGEHFVASSGLPVVGGAHDTLNPNQVTATMTWLTGFVGRSFRGRTYLVGLPYGYVEPTGKQLTAAAITDIQPVWQGLLPAMSGEGFSMSVVSFFTGGVPRSEGVKTVIASGRLNFPLATQRRRLR